MLKFIQIINRYSKRTPVLIAIFLLAVFVFSTYMLTKTQVLFPLTSIEWQTSPIDYKKKLLLKNTIQPYMGMSFWQVDLQNLQQELVSLKGVISATVNKIWPNSLSVKIVWEKPVARWGDLSLISGTGKILHPKDISDYKNFVQLKGKKTEAIKILKFLVTTQEMLNTIKLKIKYLELKKSGVWDIVLVSGRHILLPQIKAKKKLNEFIKAYPKIKKVYLRLVHRFDLRYSDGFVIKPIIEIK